jgi:hypothetical protein
VQQGDREVGRSAHRGEHRHDREQFEDRDPRPPPPAAEEQGEDRPRPQCARERDQPLQGRPIARIQNVLFHLSQPCWDQKHKFSPADVESVAKNTTKSAITKQASAATQTMYAIGRRSLSAQRTSL